MGAVVEHCRDISADFSERVLADDGEHHACRADILLSTAIDHRIFAHVHRTAHDV